jgi:hypothetical protein
MNSDGYTTLYYFFLDLGNDEAEAERLTKALLARLAANELVIFAP